MKSIVLSLLTLLSTSAFADFSPEFKEACEGVEATLIEEGTIAEVRGSYLFIATDDDTLNALACLETGNIKKISAQDFKELKNKIKKNRLEDLHAIKSAEQIWKSNLKSATDETSIIYFKNKLEKVVPAEYQHIENIYNVIDTFLEPHQDLKTDSEKTDDIKKKFINEFYKHQLLESLRDFEDQLEWSY